jgi:hypothetical protein
MHIVNSLALCNVLRLDEHKVMEFVDSRAAAARQGQQQALKAGLR